jgi:hypothetical protein
VSYFGHVGAFSRTSVTQFVLSQLGPLRRAFRFLLKNGVVDTNESGIAGDQSLAYSNLS